MTNGSDDTGQPGDPDVLRWQGVDSAGGDARPIVGLPRGGSATFESKGRGRFAVQAFNAAGEPVWTFPISDGTADAASLAADERAVYAALYRMQVTGARIVALDVATGRSIWDASLIGLGPLHHSKYRNHVQLRLIDDHVVAFGDESAGRYVEARDPIDGVLVANRVERP
jgi:hypothetical protein